MEAIPDSIGVQITGEVGREVKAVLLRMVAEQCSHLLAFTTVGIEDALEHP